MQKYYDRKEFKALFRISDSTFWTWLKQEKFVGVSVGRRILVAQSEVDRLLEEGKERFLEARNLKTLAPESDEPTPNQVSA